MRKMILLMMLLALAACSNDSPLRPDADVQSQIGEASGSPTVPQRQEFDTTFEFVPPFPDPPTQPFQNFIIRGTGIATQMGVSVMSSVSRLNVMTGIQSGSSVVTGANGHELWYDYEGPASQPDANGNLSFGGAVTITGGTGRFEGASGQGSYSGTANVVVGAGHLLVEADLTLARGRQMSSQ